jgi:hypothetical protein
MHQRCPIHRPPFERDQRPHRVGSPKSKLPINGFINPPRQEKSLVLQGPPKLLSIVVGANTLRNKGVGANAFFKNDGVVMRAPLFLRVLVQTPLLFAPTPVEVLRKI